MINTIRIIYILDDIAIPGNQSIMNVITARENLGPEAHKSVMLRLDLLLDLLLAWKDWLERRTFGSSSLSGSHVT
jgi:hypothetical protein